MDLREQIASEMFKHEQNEIIKINDSAPDFLKVKYHVVSWDKLDDKTKNQWFAFTDICLNKPDIQKALSLLELYKQGKLVKLVERQEIPAREYPFPNDRNLSFGYLDATQDFIKANFKKVESI